jgi:outer membrane protein OmpA-like peptidoglycan-associated protein
MAKPLPRASRREEYASRRRGPLKTPAGVWLIIGMASPFAVAGVATGIFIGLKSIAERNGGADTITTSSLDRRAEAPSGATIGIENATSANGDEDSAPPIVADPVEEDAMRQEVLNRIDLMKPLSQGDKDKLYAQVERAKGFRKIAVIPFSKSGTTPSPAQIEALVKHLKEPEMEKLIADPTVLLVMVGFADKQGEESKNLEVSRARAESVLKALKQRMDVVNVMHSIGMGGQNLFDQTNLEKNRLVEVWAAQP